MLSTGRRKFSTTGCFPEVIIVIGLAIFYSTFSIGLTGLDKV